MKLRDLNKLTETLELVKETLVNWGLDTEVEFETFEDNLVVSFLGDSEHLVDDLLKFENAKLVDNKVFLKL